MPGPRIFIIGGSMGGLFAATLLHRAGFDVTVYERSVHGLEGRGAGLVAQREVFAMLREAGCEHMARVGVVARERIFLDHSGRILQTQRTPQEQLSWDVLFRTFRKQMPPERYIQGRAVDRVTQDGTGATLHFADGGVAHADLVIGADGIGSVVRAAVAGPEARPTYVGYATWRGLVPEAAVPSSAAAQLFERFAFYDGPGAHMLGYLVPGADGAITPGRRRYNWVWYRRYPAEALDGILTDKDGHRRPFSLAPGFVPQSRLDALHADAARILPPSFGAVVQAEPRAFVHAIFDYTSPRMVKGRIALLGDAAFVARPHTAMGVAKAAGDAFALRDALVGQGDPQAGLLAYEQAQREHDAAIVSYGQRLGASVLREDFPQDDEVSGASR